MVVCRLRKNREFHLNENPTRNSSDERVEHSGGGAKTAGSCSKDANGCSSNNSHSVEQIDDTGYESDDKLTNECSLDGYPSPNKVCIVIQMTINIPLKKDN